MRGTLALLLLTAALAGCATIKEGLGAYQRAADKGVGFGLNGPPDAPLAAAPATGKAALPTGLGGDKENAAYTSPPQR